MADIWFIKRLDGFFEIASERDKEKTSNIKTGEEICVTYRKPRNPKFHRKYFALLNLSFNNQDKYSEFEDFRTEIKLKSGFYKTHITTKGKLIYVPKSIAFDKMDEIRFGELYQKSIDVILTHFLKETLEEELRKEVNDIIAFS